jgi:hypothetical protein
MRTLAAFCGSVKHVRVLQVWSFNWMLIWSIQKLLQGMHTNCQIWNDTCLWMTQGV